jgi:hypothetical protein
MTTGRMIELAAALLLLAASIWLYRARKTADQGYGSQGAVLLLVVAVILGIHGLGGLDYHPTQTELEVAKGQGGR